MASSRIIVIDDVLADPCRVLEHVTSRVEWFEHDDQNFAGAESVLAMAGTQFVSLLDDAIGQPVRRDPALVFGKFRRSGPSNHARTRVHCDSGRWSAVLYISEPAGHEGRLPGTSFYTHVATDADDIVVAAARSGLSTERFDAEVVLKETDCAASWRCHLEVPYRPNRLVVFPGGHFHAAGPGFGSACGNGRITQVFQFDTAMSNVRRGDAE